MFLAASGHCRFLLSIVVNSQSHCMQEEIFNEKGAKKKKTFLFSLSLSEIIVRITIYSLQFYKCPINLIIGIYNSVCVFLSLYILLTIVFIPGKTARLKNNFRQRKKQSRNACKRQKKPLLGKFGSLLKKKDTSNHK